MSSSSSILSGSNRRVVSFVGKVLAFYGLWYVLYDLWLLPDGTVDRWLSMNVAEVSGALLGGVGVEVFVNGRDLALSGVPGVRIANGCNGLSTLGLFVGFVLAYPGSAWRRTWFIPLGILAVYLTNVIRVIAMLLTQKYWPAAFEPLHGFGLTTIFYVVVFGLWVLWANYGGDPASPPDDPDRPADAADPTPAVSPSR
jgi:exosortase/archaeosortase family protein